MSKLLSSRSTTLHGLRLRKVVASRPVDIEEIRTNLFLCLRFFSLLMIRPQSLIECIRCDGESGRVFTEESVIWCKYLSLRKSIIEH
jgi:hypothetical protein